MPFSYILLPLFGAFIGWFVVWVLYQLLFHPQLPKKILGFTVQGAFPRNQKQWASQIGRMVSDELFSFAIIEEKATSPDTVKKIMPLVDAHLDDFLRHKLGEKMPIIKMFIGEKTIIQLKETFMGELETLFPIIMKNYLQNLQQELNIEEMIASKLADISSQTIKTALKVKLKREFILIGILSASIGFVLGLLEILILRIA